MKDFFWDKAIKNKGCRLIALFLGLLFGLYIALPFIFLPYVVPYLQCLFSDNENSEQLISYLSISVIGIPVFTLLWLFRTYDIREQIQKSQEQIDQNELFRALSNLDTSNPQAIKIAVSNLIKIAKNNKNHHQEIRLVFIERLKQRLMDNQYFPIADNPKLKLTYAQYILKWLAENPNDNNLDLSGCCFDDQKFVIKEFKGGKDGEQKSPFTILFEKRFSGLSFTNAQLKSVYLQGASLQEADLRGADLQEADLRGADLQKADLQGAYLEEADLRGAYLQKADLRGAKLSKLVFTKYKEVMKELEEINSNNIKEEKIRKEIFKNGEAPDLAGALFYQKDLEEHNLNIEKYKKLGLVIIDDPKLED